MTRPPLRTLACALALLAGASAWAGKTVDAIKQRDQLVVGVSTGVAGFSAANSQGQWTGLDVDIGKAVAAALLGDANKVKWVPLASQQRFTALQSGEVDVLSRNTTLTLTRDASMGLSATAVVFYDGQGFMVPAKLKVKSAKQLKNATVCVQSGTTTEKNLTDFSKANKLNLKPVVFEKFDAANAAYFAGRCQAYTTDTSGLAAVRAKEAKDPKEHLILPEVISKEPLGPLVRRGDEDWAAIVRWVVYGLIEAEENGITQANVDQLKADSSDPVVMRLLGKGEDTGKLLGLDREWLARAIKAVGHYGEIYERNVGEKTPVGLPRGKNRLWSDGGLMYALPIR
jgi:general L-amino acid transport system substrate-binding protein